MDLRFASTKVPEAKRRLNFVNIGFITLLPGLKDSKSHDSVILLPPLLCLNLYPRAVAGIDNHAAMNRQPMMMSIDQQELVREVPEFPSTRQFLSEEVDGEVSPFGQIAKPEEISPAHMRETDTQFPAHCVQLREVGAPGLEMNRVASMVVDPGPATFRGVTSQRRERSRTTIPLRRSTLDEGIPMRHFEVYQCKSPVSGHGVR